MYSPSMYSPSMHSPSMHSRVMRRELPEAAGLSPADMLRLLRFDPHPVALTGSWAGGGAILSSGPARVAAGRTAAAGHAVADGVVRTGGEPRIEPLSGILTMPPDGEAARFGGGWIGYLRYGFGARLHAPPP